MPLWNSPTVHWMNFKLQSFVKMNFFMVFRLWRTSKWDFFTKSWHVYHFSKIFKIIKMYKVDSLDRRFLNRLFHFSFATLFHLSYVKPEFLKFFIPKIILKFHPEFIFLIFGRNTTTNLLNSEECRIIVEFSNFNAWGVLNFNPQKKVYFPSRHQLLNYPTFPMDFSVFGNKISVINSA